MCYLTTYVRQESRNMAWLVSAQSLSVKVLGTTPFWSWGSSPTLTWSLAESGILQLKELLSSWWLAAKSHSWLQEVTCHSSPGGLLTDPLLTQPLDSSKPVEGCLWHLASLLQGSSVEIRPTQDDPFLINWSQLIWDLNCICNISSPLPDSII